MSAQAEQEVSTSPHCESDMMANIATAILSENFGRLVRPVRRFIQSRRSEHRSRQGLLRPLQQTLPEWMTLQNLEDDASPCTHRPGPLRRSRRLQQSLKPTVLPTGPCCVFVCIKISSCFKYFLCRCSLKGHFFLLLLYPCVAACRARAIMIGV